MMLLLLLLLLTMMIDAAGCNVICIGQMARAQARGTVWLQSRGNSRVAAELDGHSRRIFCRSLTRPG